LSVTVLFPVNRLSAVSARVTWLVVPCLGVPFVGWLRSTLCSLSVTLLWLCL
jgi:hypothetical protein